MSRELTAYNAAQAATTEGSQPVTVLRIDWGIAGTIYYSDRDMVISGYSISGRIISLGDIESTAKASGIGEFSSLTFSLADDGTLKGYVDKEVIAGTECIVYRHFYGGDIEDMTIMLKGKLLSPTWDESTRILSLSVENESYGLPVGYAPEEDAFTGFNNDVEGVPWPMCFGTVLKVPCVKVKKYGTASKLITAFYSWAEYFMVQYRTAANGDFIFPTETTITVYVGGVKCEGEFTTETIGLSDYLVFKPSSINMAIDLNITLAARDENDADYASRTVLWLAATENVQLAGKYCIIDGGSYGWMVNYCIRQQGQKCYFRQSWSYLIEGGTIEETAPVVRESWAATYVATSNDLTDRNYSVPNRWQIREYRVGASVVKGVFFVYSGAPFVYENGNGADLYVANLLPSSEILEVFAYRTYGDERIFVPVPSSRYTKYMNLSLAGHSVTAIEFTIPLATYERENWEDELFVSLRSYIGPNSCAIIKYILETYTDLDTNQTNYLDVASDVSGFLACFMVDSQPDAMQLCEAIAYQSRLGLTNDNGVVYFTFLPDEPDTAATVTEDTVLLDSLTLGFSSYDDITTELTAKWREDYSGRDDVEHEYKYTNNVATYGLHKDEVEVSIYNVPFFVKTSIDFWGSRRSEIWRTLQYSSFMNLLSVTLHDGVDHSLTTLSANMIKGVAQNISHNSNDDIITVSYELASKAGDVDGSDEPQETSSYWPGNPTLPSGLDPGIGREEIDYIPPVKDDPNSGDGGDDDDPPSEYSMQITIQPTEVIRGTNFSLEVRFYDGDGNLFPTGRTCFLTLSSDDSSDVLSDTAESFVGGVMRLDDLQITGGSGTDPGYITCTASDAEPVVTTTFTIRDAGTPGMTWTVPVSLVRGTAGTFSITGGPASGTVDISLDSTDNNDILYKNSDDSVVTSASLDGAGAWSDSLYVLGGSGTDHARTKAEDQAGVYADALSNSIIITGSTLSRYVAQDIDFTQSVTNTLYWLEVELPDFDLFAPFNMEVTAYDSDGVLTELNGPVRIYVINEIGAAVAFLEIGPDGSIVDGEGIVAAANGEWSYSACEIDWSEVGEEITIFATTEYDGVELTGSNLQSVGYARFEVSLPPTVSDYDTNFSMTVTCYDAYGDINTAYAPVNPVDISIGGGAGLLVYEIPIVSFVNGVATITNQIKDEDTKPATYTITVNDLDNILTGSAQTSIPMASTSVSITGWYSNGSYYTASLTPTWAVDGGRVPPYDPNDSDAVAYSAWNTVRDTIQYGASSYGALYATYYMADQYGYPSMRGDRYCCHYHVDIPVGYKTALSAAYLGMSGCCLEGFSTTQGSTPDPLIIYTSGFASVAVYFSEEDDLTDTATNWNALPYNYLVSGSKLNMGYVQVYSSWNKYLYFNYRGDVCYWLPIDPVIIQSMAGSRLHIYTYIVPSKRSYKGLSYTNGQHPGPGASAQGRGVCAGAQPLSLSLIV